MIRGDLTTRIQIGEALEMAQGADSASEQQMSQAVNFTEMQLREVALACITTNAQELYKEAHLLAEHGYYARAAVLALIGAEEFAKSIVFTVGALRPDERDILARGLRTTKGRRGDLYKHELKHLVADIVDGILINTHEEIDVTEWASGFQMTSWERFKELCFHLARYGLKSLIPSRDEASNQVKALNEISSDSAPSTLKESALYVEIDPQGLVHTPFKIEARHSWAEIHGLEYVLEEFASLPETLEDDKLWQQLAQAIQARLSRMGQSSP